MILCGFQDPCFKAELKTNFEFFEHTNKLYFKELHRIGVKTCK